jgi:hypothetical protein
MSDCDGINVSAFLGSIRLELNLKTFKIRCLQTAEHPTTRLQTITAQPHRETTMAQFMEINTSSGLFNGSSRRLGLEQKNWRLAYPQEQCSSSMLAQLRPRTTIQSCIRQTRMVFRCRPHHLYALCNLLIRLELD